ncbi:MAG: zf-TFIIB domain-containing protein [Deltaproteobacteria bacterium]|nr:zf-TFIIB domain-containing protein [Deltaproteobacteria bacterium]
MPDDEKDRFGDKLRDVEKAREDKFFADRDRELLQKLKAQTGAQEEQAARELARMRCPKCGESLVVRHKLDVELDECPQGHGVWLDSGEIPKLSERESSGWLSRFLGRSD